MNINQALKEKNRRAGKLAKLDEKIQKSGHWLKGNTPPYKLGELLIEREKQHEELIGLKVQIVRASLPMNEVLLRLAEQKGKVKMLKGIDVASGWIRDHYRTEALEYESDISEVEKDKLIEDAEELIAKLQDELDKFNATTEI